MIENPIVEEVHRIREEILAEYGGDLRAMVKSAQHRTEEAALAGRKVANFQVGSDTPPHPRPIRKAG